MLSNEKMFARHMTTLRIVDVQPELIATLFNIRSKFAAENHC
jgi:hypothetical protein